MTDENSVLCLLPPGGVQQVENGWALEQLGFGESEFPRQ